MEKVNDTIIDVTATSKQKMVTIKKFLEQKTSALMAVDSLKGFEKPRPDGDDQTEPKLDPLGQRAATLPVSAKHSCIKSHFCEPSWGLLGCVKLYKLTSAEERH